LCASSLAYIDPGFEPNFSEGWNSLIFKLISAQSFSGWTKCLQAVIILS